MMCKKTGILIAATLASALALAGCVGGDIEGTVGANEEVVALELDEIFENAATEYDVPVELLKSIGYVETGWEMIEGAEEFEGRPSAYGVMALRGEQLSLAAELSGLDVDDVRHDENANIRAAAALLSYHADELGIDRADLGAWAPAVAQFSGIEDEAAVAQYVVDDVYQTVKNGARVEIEGGHRVAHLDATEADPDYEKPDTIFHASTDYPGAIWRPSPNYSSRPGGSIGNVGMVIIHTCEGGYSGCWSWLRNSAAGASAHYVVSKWGGEISQLVREAKRAWHIAANYSCSRNSSVECWRNGHSSNHFTVGIEHAGYASQSSFPNGQIETSAKLTCDITRDHDIPRDRYHIVGHGQLQPWNRTDPGPNWPWGHYINRVRAHCNDGGGNNGGDSGGTIIVDSNNANNDSDVAEVKVSGNWAASNYSSGYYGTGYWWASTQPIGDAAEFWFYLPEAATKTVDAWWTAGSNRSAGAPWVAFNASGSVVGKKYVNQQTNGKRWVKLGTWNFSKGWNKVVLSRWAAEGKVVVGDAVRIR